MKKKIGLIALAAAVSLGGNMAFAALPQGATPLAYIKGDKNTYLDTGWTICPTSDVFEAVISITDNSTIAFWCSRTYVNGKHSSSVTMFDFGTSYLRTDYNEVSSEISRNIKLLTGYPYTITVSNGTTVVSNGARVDIPMVSSFTNTPGPLILFASGYYANGVFQSADYFGNHSLHSFKIWRNGVLVRDFVPVRANNVVTLADAVEGGVLTPLGTGAFVAGSNLDTIASPLAATVPPQLAREGAPEARARPCATPGRIGPRAQTGSRGQLRNPVCAAARLHAPRIRAGRRPGVLGHGLPAAARERPDRRGFRFYGDQHVRPLLRTGGQQCEVMVRLLHQERQYGEPPIGL